MSNGLLISDVSVVDPRDGTVTPHQDIAIADGVIAAVSSTTADPAAHLESRGKYVVPGFVDMHAHPVNSPKPNTDALTLMLAHGITGFRQMAASPEILRLRRDKRLDLGERSPELLALPGSLLMPMTAGTPDKAVAEIRAQVAQGADFVKAALITPEVYEAAQAEANRLGIPLVGHLPAGVDVRHASRSGFHSIEHVGPGIGVIVGCSHAEEQIKAELPEQAGPKIPPFKIPFMDRILERVIKKLVLNPAMTTKPDELAAMRHAIDSFDEERARELAREFVANDTWNCPTLVRVRGQQLCDSPDLAANPDLRFLSPALRDTWAGAAERFTTKFTAEQREVFAAQFDMQLRLVGLFDEEGVPLLAGTDCVGAAWVVAGASLHDEFDLLARAGLSPLRVLQTTTSDPARFLGREEVAGTVEAGKEANLVLLDADPTEAVENLHTVAGVIRGGRAYGRSDLSAMKDDIAHRGLR